MSVIASMISASITLVTDDVSDFSVDANLSPPQLLFHDLSRSVRYSIVAVRTALRKLSSVCSCILEGVDPRVVVISMSCLLH